MRQTTFAAKVFLATCAFWATSCVKQAPIEASTKQIAATNKIKIGFIVKQPEEPWFQLEWKFGEQAAQDLHFELIKIGASDGEKVLAAIDNLAANGAQGFVICTPDVKLGPAIVNKAKDLGLKLMTVDDQLLRADGQPMAEVHHVGISARKIGNQVGDQLYAEMQRRGWAAADTAVAAVTFDELDTGRERTEGAREALLAKGFPANKVYAAPTKTVDVPGAFDAVNVLLSQHPEVKNWLVYSINDNTVLGAMRALEGSGKPVAQVIGIGINGTDSIAEFQKNKPTAFYGSMLLSAKEHGYHTAEMMYKWIKDGTEPPKDTRTVGLLITKDTYRDILKTQGIL